MRRKNIEYETLYHLYIEEELSQRDIAELLNIGQTTIRRYMNKYNIPARSNKEGKHTKVYQEKLQLLAQRYSKEYIKERYNTCQYCGQSFQVNSQTKHKKYCSKECLIQSLQKPRPLDICEYCGKEIIQTTKRKFHRHYCDECKAKQVWKEKQKKRIMVNCSYCGKELSIIPSKFMANEHHYCNTECMSKDYIGKNVGELSATWKGGKGHHYIGGFYTVRKIARKRDNYTCQRCGITEEEYGQELSVHHIKLYREFEDKYEANNLDNLICLCEPCHRFVHSNSNINHEFL